MKIDVNHLCEFFMSNTDDIICVLDKHGMIKYITQSVSMMYDIKPESLINTAFIEFITKEDQEKFQQIFETFVNEDASILPFSCSISFSKNFVEKFQLIIHKESNGSSKNQIYVLLQKDEQIDQQIIEDTYLSDILDYTPDVILKTKLSGEIIYMNQSSKHIAGYDPEEMIGKKWMNYVPKSELPRFFLKVNEMISGKRITDFQTFVIHKNKSIIPVEFSGYMTKKGKKRYFVSVMRDLSNRLDSNKMLEKYNIDLKDQIHQKQTIIKNMDKEIQEYINRYQLLFEKAREAIVVAQSDKLILVNTAFTKMSGYSKEEIYQKSFIEFIHPDDQDLVYDRYRRRLKGEEIESGYQFRVISRDGDIRWVEIHAALFSWNDKPATLNFILDVTEKKEIEHRYQDLFNSIPDAIAEIDLKDFTILSVNKGMTNRFQKTAEEMIGTDFKRFIPESVYNIRLKNIKKALKEKTIATIIDQRNGLWLENTFIPIHYPSGKKTGLIISKDITEMKKAEEKLLFSEKKFKEIFDSSSDAIFIHDPTTMQILDVNEEACRRFGYSKEEMKKKTVNEISKTPMFSIDKPENQQLFKKILAGEVVQREWQSKAKDGTLIWHEMLGKLIDIDGKPHFLAVARDIRDRKKVEEQMKQYSEILEREVEKKTHELQETLEKLQISEIKYRTLFEKAPIGIGIFDQNQSIVEINKSMQDLTGYQSKNGIPQNFNFAYHCVQKKDREIINKKLLKQQYLKNYEIQLRRKNGTVYTALMNIETIELDKKPYWLTIERDISELKQKEQEIKDAYSYLEKTIDSASESIVAVDKNLNIKMCNQTFLDLIDRTKKTLGTSELKSFIETPSIITDAIQQIKKGSKTVKNTITLITSRGEKRLVSFTATGIGMRNKEPEGYLFIGYDITIDASRFGKIRNGMGYLIQEDSQKKLFDLIDYLQIKGYQGIWYTRANDGKDKRKGSYKQLIMNSYHHIPFHSKAKVDDLKSYITEIKNHVKKQEQSFIVLGRIDYLLSHYPFDLLMRWFYELAELVSKYQAILLLHLPSELLSEEHLAFLTAEFSLLPDQHVENIALEESLIKILLFLRAEQDKNVLVSYHHVGTFFHISKVTTKKRLDSLQDKGLISIQEKGRMKIIKLTSKGETLLNKREVI